MVDSVCIVLLNYNGMDLLPKVMPGIVAVAKQTTVPTDICVVDNSSSDESVEWLYQNYPEIRVEEMPNRFLFSLNNITERLDCSHLLILNNDIIPEPDSLNRLIACFDNSKVFAVSPKLLCWDRETLNSGQRMASYVNGFFYHWQAYPDYTTYPTLYPIGGALLVRRDTFLELGGFDELYWPYFYEDVDLGYQAWARGWTVVYQPNAVMYHKSSASLNAHQTNIQQLIAETTNNLLFTWKNADNQTMKIHSKKLLRSVISAVIHTDGVFLKSMLRAGCRLGAVLKRRAKLNRQRVRTDQEIMLTACSISAYIGSLAEITDTQVPRP